MGDNSHSAINLSVKSGKRQMSGGCASSSSSSFDSEPSSPKSSRTPSPVRAPEFQTLVELSMYDEIGTDALSTCNNNNDLDERSGSLKSRNAKLKVPNTWSFAPSNASRKLSSSPEDSEFLRALEESKKEEELRKAKENEEMEMALAASRKEHLASLRSLHESTGEVMDFSETQSSSTKHLENSDNMISTSCMLKANQASEELASTEPQSLSLESNNLTYHLRAVICHKGVSFSCGHYVAYVYHHKSKKWSLYDDTFVSKLFECDASTKRAIASEGTVYLYVHSSCPAI
jgi:Skp family chaperone for outer membrane proteins